jgi:hypothetical protein
LQGSFDCAQDDKSDFFWFVGIGFADGGVGIFWRRRRFLDGRGHGFGGSAEAEGRERRRDEVAVEVHGVQMQELGEGFGGVGT